MRIAISGATGLIGAALVESLAREGMETLAITRGGKTLPPGVKPLKWDPLRGEIDKTALEGLDGVVHLAGESVAKRWSAAQKRRIRASRVDGSRLLVDALGELSRRPGVLVASSAVGFYGDRGDEELSEASPPGRGFLAETCQAWEAETGRARDHGVRVAQFRTGIVLSRRGGALEKMLPPFKLGLGGPLGSGRQWMSWIHIEDVVAALRRALDDGNQSGAFNLTAPRPVTNAEFTRTLGRVLRRPAFLPAPGFALRAILGEMAGEMLLSGQRVLPRALVKAGFKFQHPELEGALRDVLASGK